jgi:hypothetical protein
LSSGSSSDGLSTVLHMCGPYCDWTKQREWLQYQPMAQDWRNFVKMWKKVFIPRW